MQLRWFKMPEAFDAPSSPGYEAQDAAAREFAPGNSKGASEPQSLHYSMFPRYHTYAPSRAEQTRAMATLTRKAAKPPAPRVVTNGLSTDAERARVARHVSTDPGPGQYEPQLDAVKKRNARDVPIGALAGPHAVAAQHAERDRALQRRVAVSPGPATYRPEQWPGQVECEKDS